MRTSVASQKHCVILTGRHCDESNALRQLRNRALPEIVVSCRYSPPIAANQNSVVVARSRQLVRETRRQLGNVALPRVILSDRYCLAVASHEDCVALASSNVYVRDSLGDLWSFTLVSVVVAEDLRSPVAAEKCRVALAGDRKDEADARRKRRHVALAREV